MVSRTTLIAGLDVEIAHAIAGRMAAHGDRIVLIVDATLSPSDERNEAAIIELDSNLGDYRAIESALSRTEEHVAPLERVVFGTRTPRGRALLNATTRADWVNAVDTPLTAAFNLCRAALPRLTARNRGSLLFVLSDYAVIGLRNGAAFAAGQAALYSFAKSIAREFAPAGIRVNCLGIGWMPPWQSDEVPMTRPVAPDDLAAVADFLLSDHASYITGQLLHQMTPE